MNRKEHLVKARRVIGSLGKLDTSDVVCLIDGTMIAGYHLGNALLHGAGVSAENVHFNTPTKLERPVASLPADIRPAFEAFAELESLRAQHVRGPAPCDQRTAALAWQHLKVMMRHCGLPG